MTTITAFTRKHSWLRLFVYAPYRQFKLILLSAVITALFFYPWKIWVWDAGLELPFTPGDTSWLPQASGTLLVTVFAFFLGFAYVKIDDRKKDILKAMTEQDLDTFMRLRDERTPNATLVTLAITAAGIMLQAMGSSYETFGAAAFNVAVTTFIPVQLLVLIMYLDDVIGSSAWMKERLPEGWDKIDVDKHFGFGQFAKKAEDAE